VGAKQIFSAAGQTDTMKLTGTFHNFANVHKKVELYLLTERTGKLPTIQIYRMTGNALN
jgi:hypothetical protein